MREWNVQVNGDLESIGTGKFSAQALSWLQLSESIFYAQCIIAEYCWIPAKVYPGFGKVRVVSKLSSSYSSNKVWHRKVVTDVPTWRWCVWCMFASRAARPFRFVYALNKSIRPQRKKNTTSHRFIALYTMRRTFIPNMARSHFGTSQWQIIPFIRFIWSDFTFRCSNLRTKFHRNTGRCITTADGPINSGFPNDCCCLLQLLIAFI